MICLPGSLHLSDTKPIGRPMPQPRPNISTIKPAGQPATGTAVRKVTLEELFAHEESPLLGFAYSFVRRREIAEDLVQDAFCRLHQHWDTVENPRAWTYRAVRNLCLSWLRDHRRETELEDDQHNTTPDTESPTPDRATSQFEATGLVRAFLAELEPEDRELIHLKYTQDLSYADIAAKTDLTVSNVGYKLHHLLRNLASSLRQAGITDSRG
jgi:RNA polymerase sigma factor (sigma-70 family)